MMRASSLRGLAVVDLERAEKVGVVDEIVLDPEARRVAGLVVSRGPAVLGAGHNVLVPAGSLHAIGRDAITVRGLAEIGDPRLAALPKLSQVTGRKLVTHAGNALGAITDVLMDPADGRIVGYAFDGRGALGRLEQLVGGGSPSAEPDYVRAEADLRVGPELVVVPDDAVVRRGAAERLDAAVAEPAPRADGARWREPAPAEAPNPGAGRGDTYAPADRSPEASRIDAALEPIVVSGREPLPDDDTVKVEPPAP